MMLLCIICIVLGLVLLITTPIFIHTFITFAVNPCLLGQGCKVTTG
jgi:hypothetical protein